MNSLEKDTDAVEEKEPQESVEETAEVQESDPGPSAEDAAQAQAETAEAEESAHGPTTEDAAQAQEEAPPCPEDELLELRDRFLRQTAEFHNYRRRTEQEKARMMEFGKASVVQQLLDVVDDFERSLEAARAAKAGTDEDGAAQALSALSEGVGLVYVKLREALARAGVEAIESVGKPFDEHEHEAMMQQPVAEGQEPGIVVGEILKGYRMGDRVLRHARVIVSA